MSDVSAQKKLPERRRPRGAKDTLLFRERLEQTRTAPHCRTSRQWQHRAGRLPPSGCFRSAPLRPCCGRTLRGPQERRWSAPRCGPSHVDGSRFCLAVGCPAALCSTDGAEFTEFRFSRQEHFHGNLTDANGGRRNPGNAASRTPSTRGRRDGDGSRWYWSRAARAGAFRWRPGRRCPRADRPDRPPSPRGTLPWDRLSGPLRRWPRRPDAGRRGRSARAGPSAAAPRARCTA